METATGRHPNEVAAVAPDQMQLAVGSAQGHIRIINPDGSIIWEQKRENGPITTVSFSNDGSKLATAEKHAIVFGMQKAASGCRCWRALRKNLTRLTGARMAIGW